MSKIYIAKNTNPINEIYLFAQRHYFYVDVNIPSNNPKFINAINEFGAYCKQSFFCKQYNNYRYFFPCQTPEIANIVFDSVKTYLLDLDLTDEIVVTIDPDPSCYWAAKLIG